MLKKENIVWALYFLICGGAFWVDAIYTHDHFALKLGRPLVGLGIVFLFFIYFTKPISSIKNTSAPKKNSMTKLIVEPSIDYKDKIKFVITSKVKRR